MTGRVFGKTALLTGAARGIGHASASLLASEGARVFLADVLEDLGEEAAETIRAAGGDATYLPLDVTDPDGWHKIIDLITIEAGRLDILVNNAGIVTNGPLLTTDLDDWRRVTAVNYDSIFLGVKAALPLMRNSGDGGSIVNIASTAALSPVEWAPGYSATKAAVVNLTQAIAHQCGSMNDGIRANSILPGLIRTPILSPDKQTDLADRCRLLVPLKRSGEPQDIARGVLWLASDESDYVTGTSLVIDGGLTSRFPLIAPASYVPA